MQHPNDSYGQGPILGSQDHGPGPAHQQQHQIPRQELTPEEKRVFQECNRESYYFRSLPASLLLGGLAIYGVRTGYLKPHPRFGTIPKMVGGGIIGYFFGKVSYMETCREKFLTQLPNSSISIAIRRSKGEEIVFEESPKTYDSSEVFVKSQDAESGLGAPGSEASSEQLQKRFSYDDLREQRRRQQFQGPPPSSPPPSQQQQRPAGIMSPMSQAPPSLMPPDEGWSSDPSIASRATAKGTNKYGDEGFE